MSQARTSSVHLVEDRRVLGDPVSLFPPEDQVVDRECRLVAQDLREFELLLGEIDRGPAPAGRNRPDHPPRARSGTSSRGPCGPSPARLASAKRSSDGCS